MARSSTFIQISNLNSPQLQQFPSSSAAISIFGTQSSGKSTLMNNTFNTFFPILNTKQDRHRCTKGVWFQHMKDTNFNIIDTQGFDSIERRTDQKVLQKQIALFCLAISDVVIINLWMNEIGRYEGSHSHILRSIIKVSQRLISSQKKHIIFVVKDCAENADRQVMKAQLSSNVNSIMQSQTVNSAMQVKLNIEYHFMSHFYYKKSTFLKQAKQLKSMIKVRKSHLSNYSAQDRLIYINDLWQKIKSDENSIDLKSIEDALLQHAMERIKQQSVEEAKLTLSKQKDLSLYKTLERMSSAILKQAENKIHDFKPNHVTDREVQSYLLQLHEQIWFLIMKQFDQVILPNEQKQLVQDLQKTLDEQQNSRKLQKVLTKKRKEIIDAYKKMISTHKQSMTLVKLFSDKISEKTIKYQRRISHLFNMFENTLEKELNSQLDRQLQRQTIYFDGKQIDAKIKRVCTQYQYNEWEINFMEMWEKVTHRCVNQKLPQRIQELSVLYSQNTTIFTGQRTANLLAYHKRLQKECQLFSEEITNYFQEDTILYQPLDKIKDQITRLTQKALTRQVCIDKVYFLEDTVPSNVGYHLNIYVVFLWLVCCAFEDADSSQAEEKILDVFVYWIYDPVHCNYYAKQKKVAQINFIWKKLGGKESSQSLVKKLNQSLVVKHFNRFSLIEQNVCSESFFQVLKLFIYDSKQKAVLKIDFQNFSLPIPPRVREGSFRSSR